MMVKHRFSLTLALAAAISACSFGAARAGDNNTLRVIQNNLTGGPGNSLYVDQSAASNSLVLGPSGDLAEKATDLGQRLTVVYPEDDAQVLSLTNEALDLLTSQTGDPNSSALQKGSGNTASVTITGDGGEVQLLQDNAGTTALAGNDARITAGSYALGAVLQIGDGNTARLDIASNGSGLLEQNGFRNNASLDVPSGSKGMLVQNGSDNLYSVVVAPGTNAVVVQNGNNLQPVGVAAMQVFSTNPGTITITQSGF